MTAYTPPTIAVEYDMDEDIHRLTATSYGRTAPAGPRLFRAPPHPDIAFTHCTAESAERDAAALRVYLNGLSQKKGPSKAALRRQGAD